MFLTSWSINSSAGFNLSTSLIYSTTEDIAFQLESLEAGAEESLRFLIGVRLIDGSVH